MKKSLLLSLFLILLASCGVTNFQAKYAVGLNEVESPSDAKKQFGETKIQNFDEGDLTKYQFEDDYINIVWYVSATQFNFTLTNKSKYAIKLDWDNISYVNTDGIVGRVMHAGVKYTDRNSSQPPTTVPRGATISDILLPVDNVYFSEYVGWREKLLIPSFYQSKEAMEKGAPTYVGKQMKVFMPILIENVENDYTFVFNIDKLLQ